MEDINSGKSQVLVWITFLQGRKDTSPHNSWLTVFGAHQTCLVSFFFADRALAVVTHISWSPTPRGYCHKKLMTPDLRIRV